MTQPAPFSPIRVLFVIPQLPDDPGSRDPLTSLRVAETLSLSGSEVRVLAVTATARPLAPGSFRFLEQTGFAPRIHPARSGGRIRPEIHYRHGSVSCRVVDVGNCRLWEWEPAHGRALDAALDNELREFRPDILVVQPGGPADPKRYARARSAGAKLVLELSGAPVSGFNEVEASLAEASHLYDASLCHTEWLATRYAESTSLRPVVLPPPVPANEVTPELREPVCVTFIHPSRENGLFLLLRLAEQLSLAKPDDPILVLSSAGADATGQSFLKAGRMAGFDLGQYRNIMMADPALRPCDLWAGTQIFVAPGLANPPITLIAEALVNGIPPVVSDRAGTPDVLNGAGFALPLPLDYSAGTRAPLPVAAVEPWVELIHRLADDEAFYTAESEKARAASRAFDPGSLAPRYAAFFAAVREGRSFIEATA